MELARRTQWLEQADGGQTGLGQRLLASSADDRALLALHELRLTAA